jgi:hypothetical protein
MRAEKSEMRGKLTLKAFKALKASNSLRKISQQLKSCFHVALSPPLLLPGFSHQHRQRQGNVFPFQVFELKNVVETERRAQLLSLFCVAFYDT